MDNSRDRAWSWWYLLLLPQVVPALWVPLICVKDTVVATAGNSFGWPTSAALLAQGGRSV